MEPEVHYSHVHKSLLVISALSQMNSVHTNICFFQEENEQINYRHSLVNVLVLRSDFIKDLGIRTDYKFYFNRHVNFSSFTNYEIAVVNSLYYLTHFYH